MFDLRSLPVQRTCGSLRTVAEAAQAALHRPLGRAINFPDAALLSCTRRAVAGGAAAVAAAPPLRCGVVSIHTRAPLSFLPVFPPERRPVDWRSACRARRSRRLRDRPGQLPAPRRPYFVNYLSLWALAAAALPFPFPTFMCVRGAAVEPADAEHPCAALPARRTPASTRDFPFPSFHVRPFVDRLLKLLSCCAALHCTTLLLCRLDAFCVPLAAARSLSRARCVPRRQTDRQTDGGAAGVHRFRSD